MCLFQFERQCVEKYETYSGTDMHRSIVNYEIDFFQVVE